jgi:CHAT domain-containing protein
MAERFQDFLIRVRGLGPSGSYPVESEAGDGSRSQGDLRFDPQSLLGLQLDPTAYGLSLFEALFSGPIARTYEQAIGQARAETGGRLRVRLWIEPQAAELHAIPWERLYHSPQGQAIPLATSATNPFSRYTALDARDPEPVPTRPIGLLFALSNPTDLPEGLKPLDVDTEVRVLHEALGDLLQSNRIRVTLVPGRTELSPDLLAELKADGYEVTDGPTTFDTLTRLSGRHEIVHFVGHGFFHRDPGPGEGHAALYLEKEDGGWAAAPDNDLVDRVAPLEPPLPYLVFLSACQSARQDADAAHPFVGLGPKLVQAGVPAVVGMQSAVPAEVNRELVREFYRNLFEHGIVDLALNQARLSLYRRRDVDWAIPVLFSRLRGGRLFVPDELANRVVTAEGILEETEHGAIVTKAKPARPERFPPPVRLLPRRSDLLGRTEELAAASESLAHGRPFQFHAPAGSGKTTLLRFLSFQPPETAPDGVVYLARRSLPVDDLLEALYEATYTTDGAYKPSPTQILQLLQDVRVLVVLDDADLTREDVQRLIDSVPGASFLLASTERNLWGEGRAIDLKGLPQDVAVALFERELGERVSPEVRAEVAALCGDLQGNPLRIIQAAGRVREGSPVVDLRREVGSTSPGEALGAADFRALSPDELKVLSVLAALDGAAIDPDRLAALTSLPDAPAILEHLRGLGLAKAASPRFALTEPPSETVEGRLEIEDMRQHLLEYFIGWSERFQGDPGRVLQEIDPILATLSWARSEKRLEEFLRLARAVEEALIIGRRWATWRSLLRQEVEAAEALGDEAARSRALHQLGTQALGQDAKRSAKHYLKEALKIRRSLGDREGARITRHNLKLLPAFLIPPFVMVTFLVLAVGALTVAGATIFIGGGSTLGLRSTPASLDFGQQLVGSRRLAPVEITLTGDPVTIASVALEPIREDFFVQTDCSGLISEAGCTARVLFVPRTTGLHEAVLLVTYNGPKSPLVIQLSGIGLPSR